MKTKQKTVMTQARDRMVKQSLSFNNVFSSPEGLKVLAKLKEEFDPVAVCTDNPHTTIVRSAQRDVIKYIETMIKLREVEHEEVQFTTTI